MAISLVGTPTEQQTAAAASTLTLSTVAGIQAGDLLLYVLSSSGATLATPTTIAGWADWQAYANVGTSVLQGLVVWFRIADGTEAGSYASGTLSSGRHCAQMHAYRGVDTTTPKDAANTTANSTTTQPTHASITTVTRDAWVLGFEADTSASGVTNTTYSSSNLTVDADNSATAAGAVNATIGVGHILQSTPGAVTPVLTPTGTMSRGIAVSSALRPALIPPVLVMGPRNV